MATHHCFFFCITEAFIIAFTKLFIARMHDSCPLHSCSRLLLHTCLFIYISMLQCTLSFSLSQPPLVQVNFVLFCNVFLYCLANHLKSIIYYIYYLFATNPPHTHCTLNSPNVGRHQLLTLLFINVSNVSVY